MKDALKLKGYVRVVFKEITKEGILKGVKEQRKLDMNLVRACEARRLLDRMVGYMVTPELSNAYKSWLSAGRVQTPAVKLVAIREKEINAFVSKAFYDVQLNFITDNKGWSATWNWKKYVVENESLSNELTHWVDKSFADKVSKAKSAVVKSILNKEVSRKAPAPFTTSTLQQAASIALKMDPEVCMKHAQALYEAGLITYHRTDAAFMSSEAVGQINDWLINNAYGYSVLDKPNTWTSSKGSQEAHEAIRPSKIELMESNIDPLANQLYRLIWMRAVASQMKSAVFDKTRVVLESDDCAGNIGKMEFIAGGKVLKFAGWMKLAKTDATEECDESGKSNKDKNDQVLPALSKGMRINVVDGKVLSKKTKPAERYTQASLIKKMEYEGIGRPATYASIMKKVIERKYVAVKKRKLEATDLGISIIDTLDNKFAFVELGYTRSIEEQLDGLAKGTADYHDLMRSVYSLLNNEIAGFSGTTVSGFASQSSKKTSRNNKPKKKEINTSYPCAVCSDGFMQERKGKFWGCSNFPKCENTSSDDNGKPEIKAVKNA